jgi:hypothetical protein
MPAKIEGLDNLRLVLKSTDPKVKLVVSTVLDQVARDIGDRSQSLVPFDTGQLHDSLTIQRVDTPRAIVKVVGYGGKASSYALIQHENEEFWHPPKPPGKSKVGGHSGTGPGIPGQTRGAKYLEKPALQQQRTLGRRLITALNAAF